MQLRGVGNHLAHHLPILVDGHPQLLTFTGSGGQHHPGSSLQIFNVLDVIYIGLLTIGLAGNLDLQRLNVIEQAVRRLLDRLPLPVPGLHLVRIDPIILLQFVHDQVIATRRGRDGILQATLHQPKAIQHLRRHVQGGHRDEHQIHQVDHLLTGRVGII